MTVFVGVVAEVEEEVEVVQTSIVSIDSQQI